MELSSAATPIIYDTSKSPILEATLAIESDPKFLNNFPRNAKWSAESMMNYLNYIFFSGLPMALLFFLNAKIELFSSLIREPQLY